MSALNENLNLAVRRNPHRFPEDFMFQLTREEFDNLRSQNASSSWGGRRYPPYVFTEHGVAMLSSILVKKGKTPVLTADEARTLLDSIKVLKKTPHDDSTQEKEPWLVGLRDRAPTGVMVYTFAHINAVLQMKVSDYFVQGRRGWVRLHEKNGKEHEVPCHHNLEQYLDDYIETAGIAGEPDGPLFRTAAGRTGSLTEKALWQQDAYRMIQRRAKAAGIETKIGNHTFRATGITAYLKTAAS